MVAYINLNEYGINIDPLSKMLRYRNIFDDFLVTQMDTIKISKSRISKKDFLTPHKISGIKKGKEKELICFLEKYINPKKRGRGGKVNKAYYLNLINTLKAIEG